MLEASFEGWMEEVVVDNKVEVKGIQWQGINKVLESNGEYEAHMLKEVVVESNGMEDSEGVGFPLHQFLELELWWMGTNKTMEIGPSWKSRA